MPKNITLSNGTIMPSVGLGTYQAKGDKVQGAVKSAIMEEIRLIDTASIYRNESDISAAIDSCSVPKSSLYLTSKLSPYEQGTEAAASASAAILERLPWLDLLLIHWPGAAKVDSQSTDNAKLRHQTWQVLEELYTAGRIKAIGVSNFTIQHLRRLLEVADVRPMVNQIEVHPCYQQAELREYCQQQNIAVTAYASLGCGKLLEREPVVSIAQQCNRTASQVLLQWGLQSGCAVIPKSVQATRIKEFSERSLGGWELPTHAMDVLNEMPQEPKICWDPSNIL